MFLGLLHKKPVKATELSAVKWSKMILKSLQSQYMYFLFWFPGMLYPVDVVFGSDLKSKYFFIKQMQYNLIISVPTLKTDFVHY